MEQIDKYIVKVIVGESTATGLVVIPNNLGNGAYIITARHAVVGKGTEELVSDIRIEIGVENAEIFALSAADLIILGADDARQDFAVFYFDRARCTILTDIEEMPGLIRLRGMETGCYVKGFPKAVNNEVLRGLKEVDILKDKEFDHQVQLQVSDPVAGEYNADDLMEGYSGSPLYLISGSSYYIFGLFLAFERLTRRARGLDLIAIDNALISSGRAGLGLVEVETEPLILKDIESIKDNTRRVLGRINDSIGGKVHLPRLREKERLRNLILKKDFSVVTGDAGVGKSSLTKQVLIDFESEFEVIALQGEQLDKTSIKEIFKEPSFDLNQSFESVLNSPGLKREKIILIDSLEKLLETENAETIIDFFGLLKERSSLKIVLTCRGYAVEQLRIRFLQRFGVFEPAIISSLSSEELSKVESEFMSIQVLLVKPSLRRILEIPFNLDKAVSIRAEVLESSVNTEAEFRNIVWEYVIENREKESDARIRKARGDAFERIALDRARQMLPYIGLDDIVDPNILEELVRDNLVDGVGTLKKRYAVSHDIYEDWALTRFIEAYYVQTILQGAAIEVFLAKIGFAPAIRRVFRIWLSERIANLDYSSELILKDILIADGIQPYWKDEVIIAIMQSDYSENFLSGNKEILFQGNFSIYIRCLLLLQVACQRPVVDLAIDSSDEDVKPIYTGVLLGPSGAGWANMINFTWQNIESLDTQFGHVIPFVRKWSAMLRVGEPLPDESRNAGLIILRYLKTNSEQGEDEENKDRYFPEIIPIFFRLTSVIKDETRGLLEEALSAKKENRHNRGWRIQRELLKSAISPWEGPDLGKEIPDLAIAIAEKKWFYYPPTKQEIEAEFASRLFKSIPRGIEKDEQFGVSTRDYFPASAYQTQVFPMLFHSYSLALPFVVRLLNHSAEQYWASDFLLNAPAGFRSDPRSEITYHLPDGREVKQYGSLALWTMYRGTYVATPYLLQSVLMALEAWMLRLAHFVEKDKDNERAWIRNRLEDAVDYLLQESKSVATTSVVVSVALAYKKILAHKILPILKVKEFYTWDAMRASYEHGALPPPGQGEKGKAMQQERVESNALPHRRKHLEALVLELCFSEHAAYVFDMLDKFYQENLEDIEWRFVLNRVDGRKLKVLEKTDEGFIVQTELDEDLKPVSKEAADYMDHVTPLREALLWALRILEGKEEKDRGYLTWQKYYASVSASGSRGKDSALHNQPAVLATAGVCVYIDFLNEEERGWCIDQIFSVVNHLLRPVNNPYDQDISFGPFEQDIVLSGLVALSTKSIGNDQREARRLLFLSLILLHDRIERKDFKNVVRRDLELNAPDFLYACIAGVVAYSEIADAKIEIARRSAGLGSKQSTFRYERRKRAWLLGVWRTFRNILARRKAVTMLLARQRRFEERADEILSLVVDGNLKLRLALTGNKEAEAYYLFEAFFLIPPNTSNEDYREYVRAMVTYAIDNLEADNRIGDSLINYETLHNFERHLVGFLLEQPTSIALVCFKLLMNPAGKALKYRRKVLQFVDRCLEEVISQASEDNRHIERLWIFWDYLKEFVLEIGENPFGDVLFLNYSYWSTRDKVQWEGMTGKKSFFEPLVKAVGNLLPVARLVSTIGYGELLPEGVSWLARMLKQGEEVKAGEHEFIYLERLVTRIFYDKRQRTEVRNHPQLRDDFIVILDALITEGSATAYLIREDFISMGR